MEQSYCYWQRKFRKEAYDQMEISCLPTVQDNKNAVTFVEISAPVHKKVPMDCNTKDIKPAVVIKTTTMSIVENEELKLFVKKSIVLL